MAATVLTSPSLALWKALEETGVDANGVFASAGFDPDLLGRPGMRVPVSVIRRLWLRAVEVTGTSCIGLDAVRHLHPTAAHALGYACLASSTLREAMRRFARYYRVVNEATRPQFEETSTEFCLWLGFPGGVPLLPAANLYTLLASALTLARRCAGEPFSPLRVEFMDAAPDCAARLGAFFEAPLEFDAPRYAMHFERDTMLRVLPTGNPDLVLSAEQMLRDYLARMDRADVVAQARKLIAERLTSGEPLAGDVARALAASPRTLQRRLNESGTSFAKLLDQTRRELAVEYLRDPENTVEETAFLVGFAETASFNRAFRRWTGDSPTAFRAANRGMASTWRSNPDGAASPR
jgi:AraC-like DNA-binding protein